MSDQPPRILIACWLFSRVTGPKLMTVIVALSVPSCTPVSKRHERPDPFAPRPFPFFGILPGEMAFALLTPTSALGLRILFGFLVRN